MILWQIIFVLLLGGAFYVINWKVDFPLTAKEIFGLPVPQLMADAFLVGVLVLWLLQAFGVGR